MAYRLTYNIKDDQLHMSIQPKTGQGINLTLTRDINASLTQLLRGSASKAEWLLDGLLAPPPPPTRVIN